MTENVENLILEHLKALRGFQAETRENFAEIKDRTDRPAAGTHGRLKNTAQ